MYCSVGESRGGWVFLFCKTGISHFGWWRVLVKRLAASLPLPPTPAFRQSKAALCMMRTRSESQIKAPLGPWGLQPASAPPNWKLPQLLLDATGPALVAAQKSWPGGGGEGARPCGFQPSSRCCLGRRRGWGGERIAFVMQPLCGL